MTGSQTNDEADALAANEAFYRAFSSGDLRLMSKLWAHLAAVTCLHPGMAELTGRDAVMRSFAAILSQPPSESLNCISPRVRILGKVAVVTCYEAAGNGPAHLAATNVFVLENREWKMVHHHAGPLERPVAVRSNGSMLN